MSEEVVDPTVAWEQKLYELFGSQMVYVAILNALQKQPTKPEMIAHMKMVIRERLRGINHQIYLVMQEMEDRS